MDIHPLVDAVTADIFNLIDAQGRRFNPDGTPRSTDEPDRDVLQENGLLLLRDFLVCREYRDAVRHGDVERIVNVLYYWCVIFQDSGHNKYSAALVEIAAGFGFFGRGNSEIIS